MTWRLWQIKLEEIDAELSANKDDVALVLTVRHELWVLCRSERVRQRILDKAKNSLRIITFLPRNRHFAKPGTDEIVVEGIKMCDLQYEEIE